MRFAGFAFAAAIAALGMTPAMAAPITIGVNNSGNCYPGLCNDSGTNVGPSIDYQQVYTSSAFSGVTSINAITFYFDNAFSGTSNILSGNYTISLGYTNKLVNGLSNNLASNILGSLTLFLSTAQTGSNSANPSISIIGTPFTYDPSLGNLLLEIDVTNQANVPNGSGNGFFEADETGLSTSRVWCLKATNCVPDATGLVTTFDAVAVPEPVTLSLFGVGLAGAAALRRKRAAKKA